MFNIILLRYDDDGGVNGAFPKMILCNSSGVAYRIEVRYSSNWCWIVFGNLVA